MRPRLSWQDVRLAARSLARHRGFTSIAILSLALAISLNTTMYSVLDALINPRIDLRAPSDLYWQTLWGDLRRRADDATRASLLREASHLYEGTALYSRVRFGQFAVEYGRRYQQASAVTVSPNLFAMLGVRPQAGRVFLDSDVVAETAPVMISERLAATLFPDGTSPIGAIIDVEGSPRTVIGVLGRASQLPGERADLWQLPPATTPMSSLPSNIVRLRPGVTAQEADRQLQVLANRLAAMVGEAPGEVRYELRGVTAQRFNVTRLHYALIAAVVAVLVVACANLANLQLARGISRGRELAVRAALGASRRDIIAHLLLESVLLAAAGLVAGLVLTYWGTKLLTAHIPPSVADYIIEPQTSWRVLAFAAAASVLCVVIIGLFPALRVSRVDPNELLKAGAGTGANKRNRRQYGLMIVLETGLALALLCGAAIVVRVARDVQRERPAFNAEPLSAAWMLFRAGRDTTLRHVDIANQLLARARGMPDVVDATTYTVDRAAKHTITVYGLDGAPREVESPMYNYRVVTPSYFRTFGIAIAKGRDFLEGVPSEAEVIIDSKTARFFWPGRDPIGQQLKLGDVRSDRPWVRVVGVTTDDVDEVRVRDGLRDSWAQTPKPKGPALGAIYYLPSAADEFAVSARGFTMELVVRSRGDHERAPITMRRHLQRLAPFSILSAQRMEDRLGMRALKQSHGFMATTFAGFAVLALGLAALGIFAIVAHSVAERKRELGVRIALGASSRDVLHAVLREGNVMLLAGVAVGLVFTSRTMGWLRAFSRELDQYDAPLFAMVAAGLCVVALLAALWPALRATQVDPVESLRSE